VDGFEIIVASRPSQTRYTEPFLARAVITADPPGLTTHQVALFPRAEDRHAPLAP
jgi:hypothetical protein